ncbi:uncharacterized protein [Nicotiana tomentosiformis]|uniref:uncharacterized protein n=1 Tax=Nicotiana tomentosiformis TaxID=4098 RepID=UPI00388C3A63
MRFLELDRHVIWLVPTERENIRRFIDGLSYQLCFVMTRENASGARFNEVVDIARRLELVLSSECEEREARRPRGLGGFSGVLSRGQSYHNKGHPYRPAQMARQVHRGASASHDSYSARPGQLSLSALPAQSSYYAPSIQGSSAPGSSSGYSGSRGLIQSPPPLTDRGCYECGELGLVRRYCPRLLGGPVQQRGQATNFAPIISLLAQPVRGGA